MATAARGSGSAGDAAVETDAAPSAGRVEYLELLATAAEEAADAVEDMIADLRSSLAERRAEAKQARADALRARNRLNGDD